MSSEELRAGTQDVRPKAENSQTIICLHLLNKIKISYFKYLLFFIINRRIVLSFKVFYFYNILDMILIISW